MRVAVVDYGSGNLHSVIQALQAAGRNAGLDHDFVITDQVDEVAKADRLVLPGVGNFVDCARNLKALDGMTDVLEDKVLKQAVPFLGICVGMQLLAEVGYESSVTEGLGWIKGEVRAMEYQPAENGQGYGQSNERGLKIPHMGWNGLDVQTPHPVMAGIDEGAAVYFVHSYHFTNGRKDQVIATTDYGRPVVAAIGRDNIFGVQFHPEKSQYIGQCILTNWLNWKP
jgi:glutamine amidotransferase